MFDITEAIRAKSDQLNADDLVGGPITVRVERVTRGDKDQPVVVHLSGGHMPLKPSKTVLRVLAFAWGTDADQWSGKWMRLYRDPSVTWAGKEVGGVRVSALSHIDRPLRMSLAVSKGKKAMHTVDKLEAPQQSGAPTANLARVLEDNGATESDLDAWRAANGKGPASDLTPEQRSKLAVWLLNNEAALDAVKGAKQ